MGGEKRENVSFTGTQVRVSVKLTFVIFSFFQEPFPSIPVVVFDAFPKKGGKFGQTYTITLVKIFLRYP